MRRECSEEIQLMLLDSVAGRLQASQQADLDAHLRECAACAAIFREQSAMWSVLDVWEAEPVSSGFNRQVWQRIEESGATPWHRGFAWKSVFPLTAAAALLVAGFVFDHRNPRPPASPGASAPVVSSAEAEQAEKTLEDLQLLKQLDPA